MIYLFLFIGTVVRLISLNQSLWLDEATTALVSRMPLGDIFTKFMPGDFHPPLYYLVMKAWVGVFGSSEISLRIPSVIFGVGVVYFVFMISKKLFDNRSALISALLASTSGLLIYYSQEARMYMLAALLVAALFYLFIEKKWVLFATVLALAGMTDYLALLVVPVFLIFSGKDFKKVVKSLIPLILIFILWSPVFAKQLSGGIGVEKSAWWGILGTLSWKNMALIPVKFVLGRISFDNRLLYGVVSIFSVLAYLYIILLRPVRVRTCRLLWGWLLLPILIAILISVKIPVLTYFRFIFCLPALYILIGKSLSMLNGKRFLIAFLLVFSLNIFSSFKYLSSSKFHRENWRDMAIVTGSETVVFPSNSQKEALTYYGKGDNIVYYKDFTGEETEIWLSRYVWDIFDSADMARIKVEGLGYNKVQEINLNGVEFWNYRKL